MLHELSDFLVCGESAPEVMDSRNPRSPESYFKELFADAGIVTLLVDDGYSELAVEHAHPRREIDEFRKYVPVDVARISRIERLLQEPLAMSHEFSTFVSLRDREN